MSFVNLLRKCAASAAADLELFHSAEQVASTARAPTNTIFSSSSRRHALANECGCDGVLTIALTQAWDRFLFVYKKTLGYIRGFSLEKDPENDECAHVRHMSGNSRSLSLLSQVLQSSNRLPCSWCSSVQRPHCQEVPADHVRLSLFYIRFP